MADPHADFQLKISRAAEHLANLQVATQAWFDESHYRVWSDIDPGDGRTVFHASADTVPQYPFSLLIGDCLHNLRSGLDALAYYLAVNHASGPISNDIAETSEFPIFGDEDRSGATGVGSQRFNQVSKSGVPTYGSGLFKIRGMDPAAQAVIEGLQPYHRGSKFREHPLWILHELDRINKHRLLHFVVAAFDGVGIDTRTSRNVQINPGLFESNDGAIATDTIIARIPLGPIDPAKEMHVDISPAFSIALTQIPGGAQNISALSVLGNIFNYVYASVLPPLTPFMP